MCDDLTFGSANVSYQLFATSFVLLCLLRALLSNPLHVSTFLSTLELGWELRYHNETILIRSQCWLQNITNSNSNHQSDVPKHFVLACRTDLCEKWEGALQNFVDKKIWAHMGTSEGFDYLPVPWHVLVCEPSLNPFHIFPYQVHHVPVLVSPCWGRQPQT